MKNEFEVPNLLNTNNDDIINAEIIDDDIVDDYAEPSLGLVNPLITNAVNKVINELINHYIDDNKDLKGEELGNSILDRIVCEKYANDNLIFSFHNIDKFNLSLNSILNNKKRVIIESIENVDINNANIFIKVIDIDRDEFYYLIGTDDRICEMIIKSVIISEYKVCETIKVVINNEKFLVDNVKEKLNYYAHSSVLEMFGDMLNDEFKILETYINNNFNGNWYGLYLLTDDDMFNMFGI